MKKYIYYVGRTFAEQKQSLMIILALFLIGTSIGALGSESISRQIEDVVKNMIAQFKNLHGPSLFFQIFFHNFIAATVATASGIFFGVFPAISAFLNGLLIGSILTSLANFTNLSLWQAVLSITPHGVFEIPAFLLALSMGLTLGTWPFKEKKGAFLMAAFNAYSSIFFKVVIPLLMIAAAVETGAIEFLR